MAYKQVLYDPSVVAGKIPNCADLIVTLAFLVEQRAADGAKAGTRFIILTNEETKKGGCPEQDRCLRDFLRSFVRFVETLADVARRYPFHPEVKRNGLDGRQCG